MPATLSTRLPTEDEKRSASKVVQMLARRVTETGMRIPITENGETTTLEIPPPVANLVIELLVHIGNGEAVTLVPYGSELSTQQAADLLNVSRPYLIKLIDSGKLPHHKVGRHRRILASDLLAYKAKRDEARQRGLDEMTHIAQEADAL